MRDEDYDLVYILKPSDRNPELRWSLRSVERFCKFRKVWMVGWLPSWVQGVEGVITDQCSSKWKNSTLNAFTACQQHGLSPKFILMNDDFFATRPVENWARTCNVCLGTLDAKIAKHATERHLGKWRMGFRDARALLQLMGSEHFFDFEAHFPMVVDKYRWPQVFDHPLIDWFRTTDRVLSKRTVYGNMAHEGPAPRAIQDVKLREGVDLSPQRMSEGWISVFDGVVDNPERFPALARWLRSEFPTKCRFEK